MKFDDSNSCFPDFSVRYIENVFPGRYGVPEPWYFFATSHYWCGTPLSSSHQDDFDDIDEKLDLETEPHDLPLGISIKSIGKTYR